MAGTGSDHEAKEEAQGAKEPLLTAWHPSFQHFAERLGVSVEDIEYALFAISKNKQFNSEMAAKLKKKHDARHGT